VALDRETEESVTHFWESKESVFFFFFLQLQFSPMGEVNEQGKVEVPFSEEDAACLLQRSRSFVLFYLFFLNYFHLVLLFTVDLRDSSCRYDARTVLTLLQELANYPHSKFNWNDLVAKTSTEISNAREYQMLWRHLAYGHSMEILDHDAQPLVCTLLNYIWICFCLNCDYLHYNFYIVLSSFFSSHF